jgi:hypothetical protein
MTSPHVDKQDVVAAAVAVRALQRDVEELVRGTQAHWSPPRPGPTAAPTCARGSGRARCAGGGACTRPAAQRAATSAAAAPPPPPPTHPHTPTPTHTHNTHTPPPPHTHTHTKHPQTLINSPLLGSRSSQRQAAYSSPRYSATKAPGGRPPSRSNTTPGPCTKNKKGLGSQDRV